MATMATILDSLTTEIRKAITTIEPNTMGGTDNAFHSPKSLLKQNIREQPGRPRLFQVLWGVPKQMDGGHSQKAWSVPGTITVGYPVNPEWHVAKASDVQQIFTRFNTNDHGVSGVAFRHVPQTEETTVEDAEDDWTWVVIPLRAVVTTTT